MKIGLGVRIVAAFALFSSPAVHALSTWNWTYSSNLYTGSGTFVTDSTTTTVGGYTGYLIDSATGTWNGLPITLLAANGFGGNDDLLGATTPQLDDNGFSLKTATDEFNIYYNGFVFQAYGNLGAADNAQQQFMATPAANPVAATPEPGSLALVMTGVAGAAGVVRRRFAL